MKYSIIHGGGKMNTTRKTAVIVGMLFMIGTVAGILSFALSGPILNAPDYLIEIFANKNQVTIAALLVLIMGFALAMVPVMMFPIAKKHNEALGLAYLVFRGALETVTYIAIAICWLFLIQLSQEYAKATARDAFHFKTLGAVLMEGSISISNILILVFGIGALIFYSLLYQSKLIPRWLSAWGLIAILLHIATGFLLMFAFIDPDSSILFVMNFPIFLQEMVMAAWLIVKGFNPSAVASDSPKGFNSSGSLLGQPE
jgi:hypothetical protein